MSRAVLGAVTAALFLLTGCGGGDDSDEGESGPSPTPSAGGSAAACKTAMVASLSHAYAESIKVPEGDERDLAFAAAAGELPTACAGIDQAVLSGLLDEATQIAIPGGR